MKGNAKISSATLGIEEHGILTSLLHLSQEGCGQGFGGFRLDGPNDKNSEAACFWIKRILETVGVDDWKDLDGKYVRVDGEEFGEIIGIGHIVEDRWFYPKEEIGKLYDSKRT